MIKEAALRNRINSFVIDGEAVLLGVDGLSDFNCVHSRKHNDEVQFYAFDVPSLEGEDIRPLPLHLRKANLARLLARRVDGIFPSDFEQGEIGPDLFRHACMMGLEGLVSKHRDRPYRGGRSPHWIKVNNRTHHSIDRVKEAFSQSGEGLRAFVERGLPLFQKQITMGNVLHLRLAKRLKQRLGLCHVMAIASKLGDTQLLFSYVPSA